MQKYRTKAETGHFCDKSLKPWFIVLIGLTVFLVGWIIIQKEELILSREMEAPEAVKSVPQPGNPVMPNPIRAAAYPSNFSQNNYGLAAITKATPHGGVQLVANPTHVGFQNDLKDAVNTVIPTVCDIHAIWINRSSPIKRPTNPNNIGFLPPFDGVIDKFVQNKGYENIGAGILVDSKGYVLTNNHVVLNAKNVVVTVPGNPSVDYTAKIVAQNVNKDIALLKLNADQIFPEARLGDSSFVTIGDYVIAVGSPFGMEQTVTSGIISGIRKSIMIDNVRYNNLFQTDAPINRGSSGGPLVNLSGEVIGVTTAIYAPTGVFNGTGFAIPINDTKDFISQYTGRNFARNLDQKGMFEQPLNNTLPINSAVHVQFGIEAVRLDPAISTKFSASGTNGVLVNRVFDNSPASFAFIKRGDVITAIAGVPVESISDIPQIVSNFKPGDNVHIRFLRNRQVNEVIVKLR